MYNILKANKHTLYEHHDGTCHTGSCKFLCHSLLEESQTGKAWMEALWANGTIKGAFIGTPASPSPQILSFRHLSTSRLNATFEYARTMHFLP